MSGREHDDPEEHTGAFSLVHNNERTLAFGVPPEVELPPQGPRQSFLIAYDRLFELASAARNPSFAVAAIDERSRLVAAELLEAGNALTIGRHTHCRIRLASQAVSLRHIVALARLDEMQRLSLHLWDLNTRMPFRTEQGESTGGLVADGPTYITLGPIALWFLPCGFGPPWPVRALDAYRAMPARSFLDRRDPNARKQGTDALPPQKPKGGPYRGFAEASRVTTLAPPLLLGDDEEPEIAWGTIRIQSGPHKTKRRVSAERLAQGLLVGRYERCGLSLGQIDNNVSRVHFLLVRIENEVWAIDTGSTNGIRIKGHPIQTQKLNDQAQIEFGSTMLLTWTKLEHPVA